MIWYVALIAILNLGLGYAFAVYTGAGRGRTARSLTSFGGEHSGDDEPQADDSYEEFAEEDELEAALR